MKRVLLLGILLSSITGAFAQETEQETKKGSLLPPYFGVFTRIEGLSAMGNNGIGNNYNTLLSTTGVEGFIGKGKIYFYLQLYFQYDIGRNSYNIEEHVATSAYALGNLIGMGGYLFDKRSSLGTGWSMVMNGGFGTRFYFPSEGYQANNTIVGNLEGWFQKYALYASFTLEINASVRYHISQNLGLQFGAVAAMDMIAPREGYFAMRYGASFGIVF